MAKTLTYKVINMEKVYVHESNVAINGTKSKKRVINNSNLNYLVKQ